MKKTAIKLTILSIILLVSISSMVLGANNDGTNVSDVNGTNVGVNATDTAVTPTDTNATVAPTDTEVQATTVPTPEETVATSEPTPEETSVPQEPVKTPKSPGFESVVSVAVLLLAMYINKRK